MKKITIALGVIIVALIGLNAYLRLDDRDTGAQGDPGLDDSGLEAGAATATQSGEPQAAFYNYFVQLEAPAQGELSYGAERIGCGDAVVPVKKSAPRTQAVLRAALDALLSTGEKDVKAGRATYYNALYRSDVAVDSVKIENGVADVRLKGDMRSGGVCDDPRIIAQIKKTVEQFPTVKSSRIFINNVALEEYFSGR